jgi:hypothetical protein
LLVTIKTLAFISSKMGEVITVLNKVMTWSDIFYDHWASRSGGLRFEVSLGK